ncbi:MAG: hypothetical protein MUC49_15790 [Raineya sp.]|jgi:hypothetical protein|nr:hypothetical protein [Raineya sp.]
MATVKVKHKKAGSYIHPVTRVLIPNGDFVEVEHDDEIEKQIVLGRLVKDESGEKEEKEDKKTEKKEDKKEDKKDSKTDKS